MPLQQLSSTDAFVVTDIPDAPATGVVRTGKKILQSSASDLARSVSYSFAAFEIQRGGASAGINATDDAVAPATAALCTELADQVRSGQLQLDPGKGTDPETIHALTSLGDRSPLAGSTEARVAGIVAACAWARGGDLDGASVAVEGDGPIPDALGPALVAAGASMVTVPGLDKKPWMIWGAPADLIVAGSKPGTLTHQGAPFVKAKAVVPWGPIPFTTKAFAELRRAGVEMLPDFLSTAGSLLPDHLDLGDDPLSGIADRVTRALDAAKHGDGVLLGACYLAESFLASWIPEPLFGRPLAA